MLLIVKLFLHLNSTPTQLSIYKNIILNIFFWVLEWVSIVQDLLIPSNTQSFLYQKWFVGIAKSVQELFPHQS
jgi:hypothetical protein